MEIPAGFSKLFCKHELLAAMCLAGRVLHLWHGVQNRAYAETSVLRAPAAEKSHSLYWLIAAIRCTLPEGPLSIWAVVSLPNDIPWHPICSTSIPLDFAVSLSGTVQTNDSPFPPSARTSGLCAVPAARLPRTHAKEVNYGKTQ